MFFRVRTKRRTDLVIKINNISRDQQKKAIRLNVVPIEYLKRNYFQTKLFGWQQDEILI